MSVWALTDPTTDTPWTVVGDIAGGIDVVLACEPVYSNIFNLVGGTVRWEFGGQYTTGRDVDNVEYVAVIEPSIFVEEVIPLGPLDLAIESLNYHLHSYPVGTKILVMGHSLGAVVSSRWLDRYADDVDAPDAADVRFLLFGSPYRKYGGRNRDMPHPTRTDTQYDVTDATVAYDYYSDMPTAVEPTWQSLLNVELGFPRHTFGYLTASLDAPENHTYEEGNTTFVFMPRPPTIPGWGLIPEYAAAIEESYDRPEMPQA